MYWIFRFLVSNVHVYFPVSHAVSSGKRWGGRERKCEREIESEMEAQNNKITISFDALKKRCETHAHFPGV